MSSSRFSRVASELRSVSPIHPDIWILLTHAPGDNAQCLALADALDGPVATKRADWPLTSVSDDRARIRDLLADTPDAEQRRQALGLQAPWPRLIACCGRRSERIAFWIKRRSQGTTKVVSIGRAHGPIEQYDLLIATPQFLVPERPNVMRVALPLMRYRRVHTTTRAFVPVPKPWFTILLGGDVTQFAISTRALKRVARRAQAAAQRHGGSVVISTSRRTPPAMLAAVESVLERPYIYRWSENTGVENPYETLLQQSAALFVTADSVSMILDACATGTPTFIIEQPQRLDFRRRLRRGMFGGFQGTAGRIRDWGFRRAADRIERIQDWLHQARILHYPRDLRRILASVYAMGLARSANTFDPAILPLKRIAANDLVAVSGISAVVARCRALHGWAHRIAAE